MLSRRWIETNPNKYLPPNTYYTKIITFNNSLPISTLIHLKVIIINNWIAIKVFFALESRIRINRTFIHIANLLCLNCIATTIVKPSQFKLILPNNHQRPSYILDIVTLHKHIHHIAIIKYKLPRKNQRIHHIESSRAAHFIVSMIKYLTYHLSAIITNWVRLFLKKFYRLYWNFNNLISYIYLAHTIVEP